MPSFFPFIAQAPITESLEWGTNVLEGYSGVEQRVKYRAYPRQRLEYRYFLREPRTQAKGKLKLAAGQADTWYVPVWQEATNIVAAALDESISVTTAYADYRAAGKAIVYYNDTTFEVVTTSTINADSLDLSAGLTNNYPAGSVVAPLRQAILDQNLGFEDHVGGILRGTIAWSVTDNIALTAYDLPTQYGGYGVFLTPVLRDGTGISRELFWPKDTIDFSTGVFTNVSRGDYARLGTSNVRVELGSRQTAWEFRRWLHGTQGQITPFWLPTFQKDIAVASAFGAADVTIEIEDIGLSDVYGSPMFSHVAFCKTDGTYLLREISGMASVGDTEQMTLDSALGFIGDNDSFSHISFMPLVRLGSDRVELSWRRPDDLSAAFSVVGVL